MTDGDVSRIIKDVGLKIGWVVVALIKIGNIEGHGLWGNIIVITLLLL